MKNETKNDAVQVTENKVAKNNAAFNGLKLQAIVSQGERINIFDSIFTVNTDGSTKFVRKAIQAQVSALMDLTGKQLNISKGKKFNVEVTTGSVKLLKGTYFHNRGVKASNKFWREIKTMLAVTLPEIMEDKEVIVPAK